MTTRQSDRSAPGCGAAIKLSPRIRTVLRKLIDYRNSTSSTAAQAGSNVYKEAGGFRLPALREP
jgi:hypothetical protein